MATIQLGRTKTANKLISYAEKRAVVREGVDCPPEYAKSQFTATRELWGKNDGVQAHHVIQSFKPNEVTPEMANKIGQDLAREIAPGHEVVVYTHADKAHIHNHIVINSVNYETGKKFHAHGEKAIEQVRQASDKLCKEHNLSVVKEPSPIRYKLSEKAVLEKGQSSWKDEIREKVDSEKKLADSYENLKKNLFEKHGIEIRERGKNITYVNQEGQKVRGNKLGNDYEKETIQNEFKRSLNRTAEHGERGNNANGRNRDSSNSNNDVRERGRISDSVESSRKLSVNGVERGHVEGHNNKDRARNVEGSQQGTRTANGFDLNEFNKRLEQFDKGIRAEGRTRDSSLNKPKLKIEGATRSAAESTSRGNENQSGVTDKGHDHHSKSDRQSTESKSPTHRQQAERNEPKPKQNIERNVSKSYDYDRGR